MTMISLRPMIWTEDFAGTIRFYTEVLGFTCQARMDDVKWASLALDDAAIMVSEPNEHTPYDKIGFTGTFYLNSTDVDAVWEKR